jgi:hypothetical protein
MAKPIKEPTSEGGNPPSWNPLELLREARRAVPSVRFALGVLGVMAVGTIGASWFVNLRAGVITFVSLLACMYLLLFFSVAARIQNWLKIPVLIFACVLMLILIVSMVFAAYFVFTGRPKAFGRFFNLKEDPAAPVAQAQPSPKPAGSLARTKTPKRSPTPSPTPLPTPTPPFITMKVIDKKTGAGIRDAYVECGDSNASEKTKTEPSGKFSCHILQYQQILMIYIEAPGYSTFQGQVNLNEIKDGDNTIALEPR